MTGNALLAWIVLSTGLVLVPGPDTVIAVSYAVRRGLRDALWAVWGGTVGGVWYIALCGFGFLTVLAAYPTLYTTVKIAGAIYLAWLGLKLLRGALRPQPDAVAGADRQISDNPFYQGLLTTVLNPKIALFFLAILPQFVGAGPDAPYWGMLLIAISYAMGFVWLVIVAIVAARASSAARQTKVGRWIEGMLGVAFMGFAARLATARSS